MFILWRGIFYVCFALKCCLNTPQYFSSCAFFLRYIL